MSKLKQPLVLVVDDESGIVELFKDCLEDLSFSVETATSGEEAIQIFQSKEVDCVVSDVSMPGMNGIELVGKVKALNKDCPIFFMTGYHDIAREELNHYSPKAIIFKPFDFEEAALLVKNYFLRRQ